MELRFVRWAARLTEAGAVAWAVLVGPAVSAQVPILVKDILTSPTLSSTPTGLTRLGNHVLFFATDDAGTELWTTDGTADGTVQLLGNLRDVGVMLGVVNGNLLFALPNAQSGLNLWRTDGTTKGTVLFAVLPYRQGSLAAVAAASDAVYLIWPGTKGWALYRTDGSTLALIANIAPETTFAESFFLVPVGARVFFPGDDGVHGLELWTSDGTSSGTGMVADLWSGSVGSEPKASAAGVIGSRLFFVAATDLGCQLWVSDGTPAGTRLVKAFAGAKDWYNAPSGLTALDDTLLFQANDGGTAVGVWRSDGTAEGTVLVSNTVRLERPLGVLGGSLVFQGSDLGHGSELWLTDGTAAGTRLIADLNPGPHGIIIESTSLVAGGRMFLPLAPGLSGDVEPWVTDGTEAGTVRLADINPGEGGSYPYFGAALGSTVFFPAYDPSYGTELWRTDGIPGSTGMVRDINLENNGSVPWSITNIGGSLVFFTLGLYDVPLWRSNGSEEGTAPLHEFARLGAATASGTVMERSGGRVFFVADDGTSGMRVWQTDGTPGGTSPFPDSPYPARFTDVQVLLWWNGALHFFATEDTGRRGLWRTDGTTEGTWLIMNTAGKREAQVPDCMVGTSRRLFFLAGSSISPDLYDLFVSDGTPEGTALVRASGDGFFLSDNRSMTAVGDDVILVASDGVHGNEWWRSDGTRDGTAMLADVMPNDLLSVVDLPSGRNPIHGRVVFSANDGVHGWELWATDGTSEGTRMIADILPGSDSSVPSGYSGFLEGPGDTFYFTAYEPERGRQLWASDFTEAGTHLVAELFPPPYDTILLDGRALGPYFFFSAAMFNPYHPYAVYPPQMFVTQGTADTTHELIGAVPPDPRTLWSRFEVLGNCLFFCGGDNLHGQELWKICPEMPHTPRRHLTPAR